MTDNYVSYPMLRFAGFVFGIPILALGLYHLTKVSQAQTWPWTTGVVSRSEVGIHQLFLEVPYRVGSAEYVCRQIQYGQTPSPRDRYRYYRGANTRIYYDPKKPESCVLEPEVARTFPLLWIFGFALVACGLYAHGRIRSMQMSHSPASPRSIPSVTSGSRYTLETVRDFAMAGRTIDAIKAYREVAGVGLKEAKEYVDKLVKNQQPRS
jgi:hypothetical protein